MLRTLSTGRRLHIGRPQLRRRKYLSTVNLGRGLQIELLGYFIASLSPMPMLVDSSVCMHIKVAESGPRSPIERLFCDLSERACPKPGVFHKAPNPSSPGDPMVSVYSSVPMMSDVYLITNRAAASAEDSHSTGGVGAAVA